MRSRFGLRLFSISFSIGTKNFLILSLGGSGPSWWHPPFEGRVCGGLTHSFAPEASFSDPYANVLRDGVTLWVKCVGRFPLDHERRLSLVVSPRSFRMGFEPLSEASLRALLLAARFLVVLTVAASLREFKALSSVLPFLGSDTSLAYVPQFGAW